MSNEQREQVRLEGNKKSEETAAAYSLTASNARHQIIPLRNMAEEVLPATPSRPQKLLSPKNNKMSASRVAAAPQTESDSSTRTQSTEQKVSFHNTHTFFPQPITSSPTRGEALSTLTAATVDNSPSIYDDSEDDFSYSEEADDLLEDYPLYKDNSRDACIVFHVGNLTTKVGILVMQLSCITVCYPLFILGTTIAAIGLAVMTAGMIMKALNLSLPPCLSRIINDDIEMDSSSTPCFA